MNAAYGSNFINKELFNLTGTLPADRIEQLLEMEASFSNVKDMRGELIESFAGFPSEDALGKLIKMLYDQKNSIHSNMRVSELKESFSKIINAAETEIYELTSSAEYGIEKIDSCLSMLHND